MDDDRPVPQYGEYATPEQQAAAMGITPDQLAARVQPAASVAAADDVLPPAQFVRPRGYANRFFTVLLLAFGALTLFENIPALLNYAGTLRGAASAGGLASLTVPASVDAAGIPTLIANVVLYAATLVVSLIVLRRGHVSFYIPIIGWALFGAATVIILLIVAPSFALQFAS